MPIQVEINGRSHSRDEVLRWEDTRIDKAAKKLGVPAPPRGDIAVRRGAFFQTKIELGRDEIFTLLRRDIAMGKVIGGTQARMSRRRRRSVTDLFADGVGAGDFVRWFEQATRTSDPALLKACPDHFDLRYGHRGQEVLETTGGSPFAVFFFIDFDDVSSLTTLRDPAFPHQVAAVARAESGTAIGGVRHQFRDTEHGLHARLLVEFPLLTLPTMVAGHRWHLAYEFSNWVEAAAKDLGA